MRIKSFTLAMAITTLIGIAPAGAQQAIKIGVILPYSGQFADIAAQLDNGIKLYVKQHGDVVAGKKIEFIRKDVGGIAPAVAKRLAQELVVRDKVDILAGFVATPNGMAASEVSDKAKKFMVIMNAATSSVITKSRYSVRTSFTIAQVANTFGAWAAKNGIKSVYTMVSDYGPGHDAEVWFDRSFKAGGGKIVGSVRMPVANPDFSAFVQKVKDANPEAIFVFVPGGAQPPALGKALAERGINPNKIKILGTGEVTDEQALKSMGNAAVGIVTAYHYDYTHDFEVEPGVREGIQQDVQSQSGLLLRGRVRRHARHLRSVEEDWRQNKRRPSRKRGERNEMGKPARSSFDRSADPRYHQYHLCAARGENPGGTT